MHGVAGSNPAASTKKTYTFSVMPIGRQFAVPNFVPHRFCGSGVIGVSQRGGLSVWRVADREIEKSRLDARRKPLGN
jgi:hypothetical protein